MDMLISNATTCRVKRHYTTTPTHEHASPAETKPDSTILTQGLKWVTSLKTPNFIQEFSNSFDKISVLLISLCFAQFERLCLAAHDR